MMLHQCIGLPTEEKHIVSLCGSGGKTTLMYALAEETRVRMRTAVFTTTHIFPPEGENMALSVPMREEECRAAWENGKIVATGRFLAGDRKFSPPEEEEISFLCREGQAIFIEADGSRRLPLKYPAPWEPVIRRETTHVIVVAGLTALGRPAEEVIHRLALAREEMEIADGPVSEETAARLLWKGYARYSPVFVLNQADDPVLRERGEHIAALLRSFGAKRTAVISLQNAFSK